MSKSLISSFHPGEILNRSDKVVDRLLSFAGLLLLLACGLLPILFIPSAYVPQATGKVMLMVLVLTLGIFTYTVCALKKGKWSVKLSLPIIGIWLIALTTIISAVFSGDHYDSFMGDSLGIYTAFFVGLLAVLTTAMFILNKVQSFIKLYIVLIVSGVILSLFHITRLIFGPDLLSLGIFNSATSSLIGGWNSLAIFYGLVILISLLALQQLPLTRISKYIVVGVSLLALIMLSIINFSSLWWVLALVGGLSFIYNLTKSVWKKESARADSSLTPLILSFVVLLFSVLFIIGGSQIGGFLSERLGVNYIEVRPSAVATLEIGKDVYADNLFFGIGPNKFADAWRINKDPSINQTIFWSTQFDSGYSYVFTSIINTGLLGLLAWTFFLASMVWCGIRFVFSNSKPDTFWHFIGISALVSSLYFWVMAIVYTPSASIIFLAAITTGIFAVVYSKTTNKGALTLAVAKNRTHGFILIFLTVLLIVGASYTVYAGGKHTLGVYSFNKAISVIDEGTTLDDVNNKIASAFELNANDAFAREIAFYRWSQMNSLLAVDEPDTETQQAFTNASESGLQAAQLAVSLDPTNPYNHQVLGRIYSVLALVGVEGADERVVDSYNTAKQYDPYNPVIPLLEADFAAQQGDLEKAREAAERAVSLKPNYTDALFFLAQLDISEGNTERAITIVNGIAQLEPENPARRYQLGILLASSQRLDEAINAFQQAVALDPQYANARYFLALGYAEKGMVEEAINQLSIVRDLNENNTAVDQLIEELRTNGTTSVALTEEEPLTEENVSNENVSEKDLENGLVTTSNPVSGEEAEADNTENVE